MECFAHKMASTWTSNITWPQKHRQDHKSCYFLLSQSEAFFSWVGRFFCSLTGKLSWNMKLSVGFPWLSAGPTAAMPSHLCPTCCDTLLCLSEHCWYILHMDTCSVYMLSCQHCWQLSTRITLSTHWPLKRPSVQHLLFLNVFLNPSLRPYVSNAQRTLRDN